MAISAIRKLQFRYGICTANSTNIRRSSIERYNSDMAEEPYCGNCNYILSGLTESSKCPECGKPLVEVLMRRSFDPIKRGWSRRYRSNIMLFGLPLIHVAFGPAEDGPKGHAKGILAFGDKAVGLLAVGGRCFGVVACGGMSVGIVSIGGLSFGLLAWGGLAIGGMTSGGLSIAALASGGLAIGFVACGGFAIGQYATGGLPIGEYVLGGGRRDQAALEMLRQLDWYFGRSAIGSMVKPMGFIAEVMLGLLVVIGILVLIAYLLHKDEAEGEHSSPG